MAKPKHLVAVLSVVLAQSTAGTVLNILYILHQQNTYGMAWTFVT